MLHRSISVLIAGCLLAGPAAASGRLVEVTVHEHGGAPARVHHHDGRQYVAGRHGAEFFVRLRNRTAGDVLAVVSVDGVNAVTGETAGWSQSGYVLGPGQSFDVTGWRKSLDRVAAFYFTSRAGAYAARTGRPRNVGVIGVAVFQRRPAPAPAARIAPAEREDAREEKSTADLPPEPAADGARDATAGNAGRSMAQAAPLRRPQLGTGHGRPLTSVVTHTRFERATPEPVEIVELQYDSRESLVALGVIPGESGWRPAPFPAGFVPDPY